VIAVDVGTTNIRCFIYDNTAEEVSGHTIPLKTLHPQKNWVEHDPMEVWTTTVKVIKKALKKKNISAFNIRALGMTTQRASFCLWHRDTGKPLCNFISWQDLRAVDICDEWNNSYNLAGVKLLSSVAHFISKKNRYASGKKFEFAPLQITPRLIWALRNTDGAEELMKQDKLMFGTMDTWLLWNLTGGKVHATDYSNASSTGIFDPYELDWNKFLITALGITSILKLFPKVLPTSGFFGQTQECLFEAHIPITCLVADQQSAMFAECCFKKGDCKVTIGSGCFIDVNTGTTALAVQNGMYPLVAWKIGQQPCHFMLEAAVSTIGTGIEWASREMNLFKSPEDSEQLAESVEDTNGVCFVPAFTGLNMPEKNASARGTIIGIGTATKKEHIVRALLESVGYQCQQCFSSMKIDQPTLVINSPIKVDGGVAKNNFVNQFIADVTRTEVQRADNREMTALGAAFFAGIATGVWKLKELRDLRKVDRFYRPSVSEEIIQKRYSQWEVAVNRSKNWEL